MNAKMFLGDCLEVMKDITDSSVDMILADLPYGTTACKWDTVLDLKKLWSHYERVAKKNAAIVLFGAQPFTSALVMSRPELFRYELVWDKVNLYTGTLLANKQPLRRHENVLIFYQKQPVYNKQWRKGQPYSMTRNSRGVGEHVTKGYQRIKTVNEGNHNPCSVLEIEGGNKSEKGLHPTQKPVALMEWLVKTYSNEGDIILDNTMGSGTTGVACANTGRKFVGIEKDPGYFDIAQKRVFLAYENQIYKPNTQE